jgi:predicted phosphoribosyltransferase
MTFRDRIDAGRQLAAKLKRYQQQKNTLILALPRGGVPVGFEVAQTLHLPLDIFLVRKLGVPGQEELAMGAIAMGDVEVLNENIVQQLGISREIIDEIKQQQLKVLQHRNLLYRENRPFPSLKKQTVILIDDGIATGATIRAAIVAIKKLGCEKLIIATPVAPADTYHELKNQVDEIYCLQIPEPFYAIGNWYQDFSQTTDDEVRNLLARSKHAH